MQTPLQAFIAQVVQRMWDTVSIGFLRVGHTHEDIGPRIFKHEASDSHPKRIASSDTYTSLGVRFQHVSASPLLGT